MKLAIFDVDGTLADDSLKATMQPEQYYTDSVLKSLAPIAQVVNLAKDKVKDIDYHVTVVSGRQEILRYTTENWLRTHVGILKSVNPVRLHLRPAGSSHEQISTHKLAAVLNNVRLHTPTAIDIYDDDATTLRMYHTALSSYTLNLFYVQSGVPSPWAPA